MRMPNSVLLATDIAARGLETLDITAVDHIIHFRYLRVDLPICSGS